VPPAYLRPSPVNDLVHARVLAEWLRAEQLAWSYIVGADPQFGERMTYLDHQAVSATPALDGRLHSLYAHDWRAVPVQTWLDRLITQRISEVPAQRTAEPAGGLAVLSRTDFDDAVRGALRSWCRADHLTSNLLTGTKLVAGQDGADPQRLVRQAFAKITAAQRANEWDLGGHAQKAKELLDQVNVELKEAAQVSNQKH